MIKKWRCLLFISEDSKMMFAGRQYPFAVNGILDKIKDIVEELKILNTESLSHSKEEITDWHNTYVDTFPCEDESGTYHILTDRYLLNKLNRLTGLHQMISDGENTFHFNDLLQSSWYVPYYAFVSSHKDLVSLDYDSHFTIGGATYCLNCGKDIPTSPDSMLCEACSANIDIDIEDFWYCTECGARISVENGFCVEDEYICQNCVNNLTAECDKCGERIFLENLHIIRSEDNSYVEHLCSDCFEEEKKEEE